MSKRVVIVEDEFFVANHLKKILQDNGYSVVAQYHDGATLLSDLPNLKSTVFLLDLQLASEINGVDIAKELNKLNLPFVFISANTGDSLFEEALTTSPVTYISKPFKEIDVIAATTLAVQRLKEKISVECGKEIVLIEPNDVIYFHADHVYVDVILENSKYSMRTTLRNLETEFAQNFVRCHKSYLINKEKITAIKGNYIFLNTFKIPFSRTYKDNLNL